MSNVIGINNFSNYKNYVMFARPPVRGGSKMGYVVRSLDGGARQLGGKGGKQVQDLSNRPVRKFFNVLFKARDKAIGAKSCTNIRTILFDAGKKAVNLFLTSRKSAAKDSKDDSVIPANPRNRQVKSRIKLTKMEMGEYDLKAALSAMIKHISQLEEKTSGCQQHKKAVADKIKKLQAQKRKERTGCAAPDPSRTVARKHETATSASIIGKDCLLTLDGCRMSYKPPVRSRTRRKVTQQQPKMKTKGTRYRIIPDAQA